MTHHLPECWLSEGKWDGGCICDRLRACEQRVLDAAREAVAALPFVRPAHYGKGVLIAGAQPDFVRRDVLATIDALREKK